MPRPRLLHPILCKIEQIDHDNTLLEDAYLKSSIGPVGRATAVSVYGQVEEAGAKKASMMEGGIALQYDGYVLFRWEDLEAQSINLQAGDRISEIGEGTRLRAVDLYIVSVQNGGHYQTYTGATLIKAFYQDRHPARL